LADQVKKSRGLSPLSSIGPHIHRSRNARKSGDVVNFRRNVDRRRNVEPRWNLRDHRHVRDRRDVAESFKGKLDKENPATYWGTYTLKGTEFTFSVKFRGVTSQRLGGRGEILSETIRIWLDTAKDKSTGTVLTFTKLDFPLIRAYPTGQAPQNQ